MNPYTMPISIQERLNRIASRALEDIGFVPEDEYGSSYFFPKELRRYPIRIYMTEFDTPETVSIKMLSIVWRAHRQVNLGTKTRREIYNLVESYKEKCYELAITERKGK